MGNFNPKPAKFDARIAHSMISTIWNGRGYDKRNNIQEIIKIANEAGPKLDKLITAAIAKF